jgi:hypothetical protein
MACPKCGTDHDDYPDGSLGAEMRCVPAQAVALGAGHLVDQVDALRRDLDERRDGVLQQLHRMP